MESIFTFLHKQQKWGHWIVEVIVYDFFCSLDVYYIGP